MKQTLLKRLKQYHKPISAAIVVAILLFSFFLQVPSVKAAGNLTNSKDLIATSRPSVATTISGTLATGATTVTLVSTAGMIQGDTVTFCASSSTCSTSETKVIATVVSTTQIILTLGITYASGYSNGNLALVNLPAVQIISFTTRSAISSPKFILTFPICTTGTNCTATAGTNSDNIADPGGFDWNGVVGSDTSCSGATLTSAVNSTAGTVTFSASSAVAASTAITCTIGSTHKFLNPTKTAATGTADTWSITVQETDSGGTNVVDQTTDIVGTIDAVAVSVTVNPAFTMQIAAVAPSTAVGTLTTSASITPTANTIPYGTINTVTAYTVGQYIKITTNAPNGYVVTTQDSQSLTKSDGVTTIPDYSSTPADNGNTTNGFGYGLYNKVGSEAVNTYNQSSSTFYSTGFTQSPVTIMSKASATNDSEAYVLYRLYIPGSQAPGTYLTTVTYIGTPNF